MIADREIRVWTAKSTAVKYKTSRLLSSGWIISDVRYIPVYSVWQMLPVAILSHISAANGYGGRSSAVVVDIKTNTLRYNKPMWSSADRDANWKWEMSCEMSGYNAKHVFLRRAITVYMVYHHAGLRVNTQADAHRHKQTAFDLLYVYY